jgi:hypothetical protein
LASFLDTIFYIFHPLDKDLVMGILFAYFAYILDRRQHSSLEGPKQGLGGQSSPVYGIKRGPGKDHGLI